VTNVFKETSTSVVLPKQNEKSLNNIAQIKKEFEENAEYEALRDDEEEKVKPYLLGVAVNSAKFRVQGQTVNAKELKIQITPDRPVKAEQYFEVMNRIIAAGLFNRQLSERVQAKIHRFEILMTGDNHCLSRRFTNQARPSISDGMVEMMHASITADQAIRNRVKRQPTDCNCVERSILWEYL
jgi:hypothetical protein